MKEILAVPINGPDGIRLVQTLDEMGDALSNGLWPSSGPNYLAALTALVEGRQLRRSFNSTRRAFISAAIEADLLPDSYLQN